MLLRTGIVGRASAFHRQYKVGRSCVRAPGGLTVLNRGGRFGRCARGLAYARAARQEPRSPGIMKGRFAGGGDSARDPCPPESRSWRHTRRRYRSCCLAGRSRNLKGSRSQLTQNSSKIGSPTGRPGFWKRPGMDLSEVSELAKSENDHILLNGCQFSVFSVPLLNASACAGVGSRWHSSSTADNWLVWVVRCRL